MIVRSLEEAKAFKTVDGSTIRELLGLPTAPVRNREAEEIYYVVEGAGEMELDGGRRQIGVGDAVLISPGAWHEITAGADGCRFLCCCAPPYRHEDTFFI